MKSKVNLRFAALTDVGCVRTNNEDNFIVSTSVDSKVWTFSNEIVELKGKGAVVVVADGMGGTNAGEIASDIAVKSVVEEFGNIPDNVVGDDISIKAFLSNIVGVANSKIIAFGKADKASEGMGTTIVVGWLLEECIYIAWCGDSRAYVYHPTQGLRQLSKDHSYVQELVNKGEITKEQAFYHPHSNVITRSLGNSDKTTAADVVQFPLVKGCRFLLCTDGLNGMIQDEKIEGVIRDNSGIVECRDRLIVEAKDAGGYDNVTVVMVDVCEGLNISKLPPIECEKVIVTHKSKPNVAKIAVCSLILLLVIGAVFWVGMKYGSSGNEEKKQGEVTIINPTNVKQKETTYKKDVDDGTDVDGNVEMKNVKGTEGKLKKEDDKEATSKTPAEDALTPINSSSTDSGINK